MRTIDPIQDVLLRIDKELVKAGPAHFIGPVKRRLLEDAAQTIKQLQNKPRRRKKKTETV